MWAVRGTRGNPARTLHELVDSPRSDPMPECQLPPEGGVGGSDPMSGPGNPLFPETDQEVMDAVRTAFFLDPILPENAFEVLSIDRVVYLRGVVPTLDMKRRAESVAGQVMGVNRVVNELKVAVP